MVADRGAHHRPVLLLGGTAVVVAGRPCAGEGDLRPPRQLRRGARRNPTGTWAVGHLTKTGTKLEHVSVLFASASIPGAGMHTAICDELGIEFPIFAFTHCRDVVVAVSKAGGFGVLGAVGFTPEQLEIELNWIDEHIGDHPYGVDIVIPNKYEGMDSQLSADELAKTLRSMVPQEHLDFARKIRSWCPGRGRRRGQSAAARLDRGDGHPTGRRGAEAPQDDDGRQRAWHPPSGHDQAHPRLGSQGGRIVRLTLAGPQARRYGRRHHHRPGRRGRRALWRGGLHCVVASGRQGGSAGSGVGGGWHRQRSADRCSVGAGDPRGMDRFAVADGRGSRKHRGSTGRIRQGDQPRHRAQSFLHG
ncbi:hypothetical protein BN9982_1150016 [Mycobacterium tuberculosis]|nr:hypothetical protein BN9982_1150016 [Mycobacterium tuberculosis]